jgi:hypothetical protein
MLDLSTKFTAIRASILEICEKLSGHYIFIDDKDEFITRSKYCPTIFLKPPKWKFLVDNLFNDSMCFILITNIWKM